MRATLEQAGFQVNQEKSIWQPTQLLKWLGFVIDLAAGQREVPQEKNSEINRDAFTSSQKASLTS